MSNVERDYHQALKRLKKLRIKSTADRKMRSYFGYLWKSMQYETAQVGSIKYHTPKTVFLYHKNKLFPKTPLNQLSGQQVEIIIAKIQLWILKRRKK